jgi:hypothetical protein
MNPSDVLAPAVESVKHGPYPKGAGPPQRRALRDKAFAEGKMIPEDPWRVDSRAMPYLWPPSRLQLAALAVLCCPHPTPLPQLLKLADELRALRASAL